MNLMRFNVHITIHHQTSLLPRMISGIQAQSETVLLPVFSMNLMRINVHITINHQTSLLPRMISGSIARSCVELVGPLLCVSVLHRVNI